MEHRLIGQTGVSVSAISLGCASIGNLGQVISDEHAAVVLELAWSRGIRYFDTAPHYGRGRSEVRLGRFLCDKDRKSYTVSTKVGRVLTRGAKQAEADGFLDPLPNEVHYDYSAEGIRSSLEGSLKRLQLDRIDIVYVHDIGVYTHGAENNAIYLSHLIDSGLPYLAELKTQGRIGAYGLGVNESAICVEILRQHNLDVILLAGRWTLLDRDAEAELVPLCRQTGTELVLGGIFNSGILAVGPKSGAWFDYAPASDDVMRRVVALQDQFAKVGVDLPHAALQFGITRPEVASVLLGTGKPQSLSRNLDMVETPLAAVALAMLG